MRKYIFSPIFVTAILMTCLGLLMNTPWQIINIKLRIVLVFALLVLFIRYAYKNKNRGTISKTYLVLLFIYPIISALQAKLVFHQELINGITADLGYYLFPIILYIYALFENRRNALCELEKIVITMGWATLLILYPIKILFPDLTFTVSSYDGAVDYTYNIYSKSSPFITWCGFIYLLKNRNTASFVNTIKSLVFLSFPIIFNNARTYTVVLFICLIVIYIKDYNKESKIKYALSMLSITILILGGLELFYNMDKNVANKVTIFEEGLLALKGETVFDISANSRIRQADYAYEYISNYYLLGCGVLKSSTKNNYITEYFYPTDIGIIGVIFNYGIIGLILFLYQIKYFYNVFTSKFIRSNSFISGTSYYLLMLYLGSIFTGSIVYNISTTFLLLGIIMCGKQKLESISYGYNYNS